MATERGYLNWLAEETPTRWWHDSGDPDELRRGLGRGACGVTTNPILSYQTLSSNPHAWADALSSLPAGLSKEELPEALIRCVVTGAAETLKPVYDQTGGQHGYVCAQVNPGIGRIVHISSLAALGPARNGKPITEAHLPEHRERLYPPSVTLSMFLQQAMASDSSSMGSCSGISSRRSQRMPRCLASSAW